MNPIFVANKVYYLNCFLRNGKYKNYWIKIYEIGIGNYGNVMKSKRKIDETVFSMKKVGYSSEYARFDSEMAPIFFNKV